MFEYFLSKSVNNKNSDIVILQIDPENYSFKLLSASKNKDQSQPVKDWVERYDLVAGINASMFWEDQQTSAGYMRDYNHINNSNIHPSSTKHSVAAIGMDEKGNVLFILNRLLISTHDLNNILLDLPINITSCVFVEGGPLASMYVKTKNFEKGWYGVSEATLYSETPIRFLKIPNIIGITRME